MFWVFRFSGLNNLGFTSLSGLGYFLDMLKCLGFTSFSGLGCLGFTLFSMYGCLGGYVLFNVGVLRPF